MKKIIKLFVIINLFMGSTLVFSQNSVKELRYIIGSKGSDSEYQLQDQGYEFINVIKSRSNVYQVWFNKNLNKCVTVTFENNIVQSIVNSPGDCKTNNNNNNNNNGKGYGNKNSNNNNSGGVIVYRDPNFSGQSSELGLGYHDSNDLGVGNDQISSIRIPSGYSVTVYADPNYKGRSVTYTSNVERMAFDFNDKISSILITKNNSNNSNNNNNYNNNSNAVVVFRDPNFKGQSSELYPGYHDIKDLGGLNDQISSIKVPNGYSVTVYTDPKYTGRSKTFTNNAAMLYDFNDNISSILIVKR